MNEVPGTPAVPVAIESPEQPEVPKSPVTSAAPEPLPATAVSESAVASTTATTDSPSTTVATKDYSHLTKLERRSLVLDGVKTTIALESVFWNYYDNFAKHTEGDWRKLVTITLAMTPPKIGERASMLRVRAHAHIVASWKKAVAAIPASEPNQGTVET